MRTCTPARPAPAASSFALALVTILLSAPFAVAQSQFAPYYGKNAIRYDNFKWHTYQTDHFEIYYYPEIEPHLERMAGYAESAYQHISGELKHDLAAKVPLILFQTGSEFYQQNVIPGAAQDGVGAFAEPSRYRILMPMDEPPDLLYRLIVHELTHIFQFDIIPTSLIRNTTPLWVNEGMSDYMAGIWRPLDLMMVRDVAIADIVPKMSNLQGYGGLGSPRGIYNLGHAAFEFMEARWGKEGVRQYVFALRKSIIGGGDDAYQEAFQMSAEEWDREFDRYLKERFKPFRDKERPADYGRDLAPNPEKSRFAQAFSIEPSPSGDLLAAMTINPNDREIDIVLLSTKDGQVVRNLTPGFDQSRGFEYIVQPGGRSNSVPWMSWSPSGDRIAYFVRTEKDRSLIVQDVVSRRIVQRVELNDLDAPESPDFSPDGKSIAFSAMKGGTTDVFTIALDTAAITNVTKDAFADYGPCWTPDGKGLIVSTRISGNEKLFRVESATGARTQLTFGTHDDNGAQFMDDTTLVFASTAVDPNETIDPEAAKNGAIYNIWTLNLKTNALSRYTDTVGGNLSPVVLNRGGDGQQVAFVSYYKGDYTVHTIVPREPSIKATTEDFGSAGPVIDFQAPLTHTLVSTNQKRKGKFEKLFLEGRPPVNVGLTSGGDFLGGTAVAFTDVLGDQQFTLFATSVSQFRSFSGSYINLERRFQYAIQGFSQTQFFYGQNEGLFYDPSFAGFIDRDLAVATTTTRGATAFGIWPFNRYRRIEISGGVFHSQQRFENVVLEQEAQQFQQQQFGRSLFNNGMLVPFGLAFVQETTVFREFGPLSGSTMRLSYEIAPRIANTLTRQTLDADVRKYFRLGGSGLLALRARGFKSWGSNPGFYFFGGNSELRGYEYLEFLGQNAYHMNAEVRLPLIHAMLTPLGVMGGIRGTLFANVGGAFFEESGHTAYTRETTIERPITGYTQPTLTTPSAPILGPQTLVSGFRLVDARASYGIGLQTFALGFPVHFDWSWRTLLNTGWEDVVFAANGGSAAFRKPRFQVWIGYDF
jgi:Tol biopolymer transport system component